MKEYFTDFYDAWQYVSSHPANSIDRQKKNFHANCFLNGCLDIDVVKINPESNEIEIAEGRKHLNTKTQIWLEYGEVCKDENTNSIGFCHNIELDCGGDTFEEAIIKLANNMKNSKHYRDMETNEENNI